MSSLPAGHCDRIELLCGDCREQIATLADDSIDACVTDPPYHLTSIGSAKGFMGKEWDGGDIYIPAGSYGFEVMRVLKPGAHLIAFSGTRTYHRMACAIEDAGFEIRDQIGWAYGSGFPKSHDVSKSLDGALGKQAKGFKYKGGDLPTNGGSKFRSDHPEYQPYEPATDAARQWQGWGTALKPAWEPCVLARKPLSEKTVAANVLEHGTGALNIDACRVGAEGGTRKERSDDGSRTDSVGGYLNVQAGDPVPGMGRWPANLIHDGSEEVLQAFPETGPGQIGGVNDPNGAFGYHGGAGGLNTPGIKDAGGTAARFFYTAKADSDDRLGSKHPTVKPVDLMQYLVRLITPPGGTVLDPFAGTGATGEAAWREGMRAVLIEREPEYIADIRRRMVLMLAGPDERSRESIKGPRKPGRCRSRPAVQWTNPLGSHVVGAVRPDRLRTHPDFNTRTSTMPRSVHSMMRHGLISTKAYNSTLAKTRSQKSKMADMMASERDEGKGVQRGRNSRPARSISTSTNGATRRAARPVAAAWSAAARQNVGPDHIDKPSNKKMFPHGKHMTGKGNRSGPAGHIGVKGTRSQPGPMIGTGQKVKAEGEPRREPCLNNKFQNAMRRAIKHKKLAIKHGGRTVMAKHKSKSHHEDSMDDEPHADQAAVDPQDVGSAAAWREWPINTGVTRAIYSMPHRITRRCPGCNQCAVCDRRGTQAWCGANNASYRLA